MKEHFVENQKRYIKFGILYELMLICVRPYAIKFLTRIGGTPFDIALFNAMKGVFMVLVVLPGVFLINQIVDKKRVTAWLVLAIGTLTLLNTFIPFAPLSAQPLAYIVLSAAMMIPTAVYDPSYQSITGELFPIRRSQVVAKRNMYTVAFITTFSLISGLVFKYFAADNQSSIFIYQILFLTSFVFGVAGFFVFNKLYYRPTSPVEKVNVVNGFKSIIKQRPYLKFITASVLFHFGWQMGWPLFGIYMIDTLGADELWLAIINIGSSIAMMIGHKFWPLFIEKYGHERTSTVATLGMALTPILYAISPNLMVLAVLSSISGIFTSGTLTILLVDLLEVSPEKNRIIFVGVHSTLINITWAISPFVGHWFFSTFNIYIALIATAVFRMIGSIAFMVRERRV